MNCGKTLRDGISIKAIRNMTGVEKVKKFLRAVIAMIRACKKDG